MILGFDRILDLQRTLTPPLVENMDAYQLLPPTKGGIAEGPCVEMRIGRVFKSNEDDVPILGYDYLSRSDAAGGHRVVRFVPDAHLELDHSDPTNGALGTEFEIVMGDSVLVES